MPLQLRKSAQRATHKLISTPLFILTSFVRLVNTLIFKEQYKYWHEIEDLSDTTYFMVNAEDAQNEIPNVNDLAFAVSIVMQALTNGLSAEYDQEHQFFLDFSRMKNVVDNGTSIAKNDPSNILNIWCADLAKKTQLPEQKIRAAICALNQSIGNGAVNFMYNLHGTKNGQAVTYRTLLQSSIMNSVLSHNGSSFSISYTIPLQAIAQDADDDLENFDIENPDIVLKSELTIKFADYFRPEGRSKLDMLCLNPDVVTHSTALQHRNPALTLDYERYKTYIDREADGFVLLSLECDTQVNNPQKLNPNISYY